MAKKFKYKGQLYENDDRVITGVSASATVGPVGATVTKDPDSNVAAFKFSIPTGPTGAPGPSGERGMAMMRCSQNLATNATTMAKNLLSGDAAHYATLYIGEQIVDQNGDVFVVQETTSGNTIKIAYKFSLKGPQGSAGTPGALGPTGDPGMQGDRGLSMLQVSKRLDEKTTEIPQESLVGKFAQNFPYIIAGESIMDTVGNVFIVTSTSSGTIPVEWAYSLLGPKGPTGSTGVSSEWYTGTGVTGTSPTGTIFSGSGVPSATIGDMYLNINTYNVYKCTTPGGASVAKWAYACNIGGPKGPTGSQGAVSSLSITGTGNAITSVTGTSALTFTKGETFLRKSDLSYDSTTGTLTINL